MFRLAVAGLSIMAVPIRRECIRAAYGDGSATINSEKNGFEPYIKEETYKEIEITFLLRYREDNQMESHPESWTDRAAWNRESRFASQRQREWIGS